MEGKIYICLIASNLPALATKNLVALTQGPDSPRELEIGIALQ